MKKAIIFLSIILGLALTVYAQDKAKSLKLYAKYTKQGVQLKVVPQRASTWLKGAEQGYNFYRREAGKADYVRLNNTAILPWNAGDINREMGTGNDSLIAFQQRSIFNQIKEIKKSRSPFESVQYRQMLENNYGFYFLITTRLPEISKISGLELTDEDVQAGNSYEYKVELIGGESKDIATCFIYNDVNTAFLPIIEAYEGEKLVALEWEHSTDSRFISYFVERSDNGDSFKRLNKAPLFLNLGSQRDSTGAYSANRIYYTDSLGQNYKPYYYRLIGVDVWGEESRPSIVMTYMGRDRTAPALPDSIWVVADENDKSLTFKWKYGYKNFDLSGLMVYHADSLRGFYQPMNEDLYAPDTHEVVFQDVAGGENHYFQLVVTDTAGNYRVSKAKYGSLPDVYPPAAPQGIKAVADSSGIVQISWNPNTEDDLKGYAVYISNGPKLRMVKVSGYPVEEPFFIDTLSLNRLNKDSYYAVRAMDMSYNYSEYSDTVAVQIPDTIPPAPVNLLSVEHINGVVKLNWVPSVSNDIIKQDIVLCKQNGEVINTLKSFAVEDTVYSYSFNESGTYFFAIISTDNSGNKSAISNVKVLKIEILTPEPAIKGFKMKKKKASIELSWKQSGQPAFAFRVYRIDSKGNTILLNQIKEMKYSDTQITAGISYSYYVCPVSAEGEIFENSETLEVKY